MDEEAARSRRRVPVVVATVFATTSLVAAIGATSPALRPCGTSTYTSTFDGNLGFGDFRREVFLRRNDGAVAPVTSGGLSSEPSISDDGRTLVYLRSLPEMSGDAPASADELVIRSLSGSDRATRLLVRASFLHHPDLSPDGRYVAVAASMEPKPPSGPRPPLLRLPPGGVTTDRSVVRVTEQGPSNRIYVLDTSTAAVVATVPAPPGALREEQQRPVFSPDGRRLAYDSNVATVDDVSAPMDHSIRVFHLDSATAGQPVRSLGEDSLWSLEWTVDLDALSVTVPASSVYSTSVVATDGALLRQQPTPRGEDVIPLGRGGTTLLVPSEDVPVRGSANFDVAACALRPR